MSYPIPNIPTMTLTELLAEDNYKDSRCAICGKVIIQLEGYIEGTDSVAFLLCEFCHGITGDITTITEANLEAVYEAIGGIVNNAINPEKSDRVSYPWV